MGYRLYYAQHYDPDWQGGYFNRDFDAWERLFDEKFAENGWHAENADIFEVSRADLQGYVNDLKELPASDQNEFFGNEKDPSEGYTNEQIIEILEEILTSDDDTIHIEFS
jgi:hypothetical protein